MLLRKASMLSWLCCCNLSLCARFSVCRHEFCVYKWPVFQRLAVETKVETQTTSQQSASLPLSSEAVNVSKQKAAVLPSVNNGLG